MAGWHVYGWIQIGCLISATHSFKLAGLTASPSQAPSKWDFCRVTAYRSALPPLPRRDDGAQNLAISLTMTRTAGARGIIGCTPRIDYPAGLISRSQLQNANKALYQGASARQNRVLNGGSCAGECLQKCISSAFSMQSGRVDGFRVLGLAVRCRRGRKGLSAPPASAPSRQLDLSLSCVALLVQRALDPWGLPASLL